MISPGSRPNEAQCSASTRFRRVNSATGPPTKFQCSATRAAVRNVRFSPLPPMQIGGCGRCTALGSQWASVRVK